MQPGHREALKYDPSPLMYLLPPSLEFSLQTFLDDLLLQVNEIAVEDDYNKITPILMYPIFYPRKRAL